jgi:tripartite-type tricarboxylate transporter receptor subunit TctC
MAAELHGFGRMHPSMSRWSRRNALAGLTLLPIAGWRPRPAHAADAAGYPSRPLRIVVGFGAGGLADITIRLIGEKLSERLGQQIVVDNRPGAGGALSATAAASAPPDGHTLTVLSTGNAINKSLFRSLPYDPVADFAAISALVSFDLLLLTGPASPLSSVAAVLAAGRRGSLTIGTISAGSTQNLAAEWLRVAAGLDATVVAYRSTPEVLTALQRGDVQLAFESYAAAKGALDGNQARAIASTGTRRSQLLPELPTLRESGVPDYAMVGWNALFAPARTPAPIIDALNRHVAAILALPEIRARLMELGVEPSPNSPAEMAALLQRDVDTWRQVIARTGITVQ